MSKIIMRDTFTHAGDHLCLIWKESIQYCRSYRADTECGAERTSHGWTDGWTDRRTDGVKPINPAPTTSFCSGQKD